MAKQTALPAKKKPEPSHSSSAVHPPYFEMISEAITALKEKTGSSQPAIAKFISDKYGEALPPNFEKLLSVQLKKFVKSDRLVKIKNSYKISSTEKLKSEINDDVEKKKTRSGDAAPKKKESEKSVKTKRLSQVKTPEALKKRKEEKIQMKAVSGGKLKRLSMAKTPEGWKRNFQFGREARKVRK